MSCLSKTQKLNLETGYDRDDWTIVEFAKPLDLYFERFWDLKIIVGRTTPGAREATRGEELKIQIKFRRIASARRT